MSGKPTARSYGHGTELKTSIQQITARKMIAQPIRMSGHDTVTARHEPYRNYRSHSYENDSVEKSTERSMLLMASFIF